ncbi:MAG: nicotinamide-nucleotide amidohydrolase family protein [Acidobacteria bacterium]|nr:nicotinamide-nucleotide amidohydrolase family protein [Acidobacteriota bacterium]
MRAALVVTGTEVLEGRVRDENGAMVAASLAAAGVQVQRITVVGDALDDIRSAVAEALAGGADLVVTTGGLGPTHDDRTMEAVALAAGVGMVIDQHALEMVRAAIATVPARASQQTRETGARKQATLPEGAVALPPPGTAPGAVLAVGDALVVVLPGPPWECAATWESARALPQVAALLGHGEGSAPLELRLANVVESEFMEAIDRADPEARGLVVGVCARPGELEVTIRPPGPVADEFVAFLEQGFPGAIFARDGSTVEQVVGAALHARGDLLGTAESCTGGLLGARLTSVPGSSAWYAGGVVSYSNAVKESGLGVPAGLIDRHGAVSAEVAGAMAQGAMERLGCARAIAITGVAGPGGGTPEKPVGLVYVGIGGPDGVTVHELRLHGDRERIRMRTCTIAMHLLRTALAS